MVRDCSWGTIKLVLGWILDTVHMTIILLPYRIDWLTFLPPTRHCRNTPVENAGAKHWENSAQCPSPCPAHTTSSVQCKIPLGTGSMMLCSQLFSVTSGHVASLTGS
ncbi:hypothetical protein ACHAXA_004914 [Cyclostephanos tholiformis]|uniref:Uncharacterized protein n=1 Tax=Cyclostephanos tholiformis TaxID=382380 RepID=A0ABD3RX09_9STRA